jgi:hypothetical protein
VPYVCPSIYSEVGRLPTHLPRLLQTLLAHFKFPHGPFGQGIPVRGEWQHVARFSLTEGRGFLPWFHDRGDVILGHKANLEDRLPFQR